MTKNYTPDFPYTPKWSGNRKENPPFTVVLRDLSIADMEEVQQWKDKGEIEITKDGIQKAIVEFKGFNFNGKEIKSVDDAFAAEVPVSLLTELIERWLAGRPSPEETENLSVASG